MNKHPTSIKTIPFILLLVFASQVFALGSQDLLPSEQAFQVSAKAISEQQIEVSWTIADGYYLYRDKTKLSTASDGVQLGIPQMPVGTVKNDKFFGEMEVYRNQLSIAVPVVKAKSLSTIKILANYQGCADLGICYPPEKKLLTVDFSVLSSLKPDPIKQLVNGFKHLNLNFFQDELLPAKQAFQFFATVKDASTLHLKWIIADDYYLYREKTQVALIDSHSTQLGSFNMPQGKPYHDETFGQVQIFHHELNFDVPLIRVEKSAQTITLLVKYQGCAERGICYPPMESKIALAIPALLSQTRQTNITPSKPAVLSEQAQIFQALKNNSLWLTLLSFFGFGLLLAFTPCIFPMIPILSGIIVGQGESITTVKAFLLSLNYVIASALTYTVFGILAALFGSNLQAIFQETWIIAVFSGVLVLLSLSMFGFYNLELPKSIQAKLYRASNQQRDNSYLGAAIMGGLSALIVGPCVAAPLAGALIYIGQTGDVLLGGSALFVMGFGMGVPLLLLGTSAGSLLPKSGHWLNASKAIFGVIMLAVAVWMLDRILPAEIIMLMTAALFIIPAIYLKAIEPLPEQSSGWKKLWKGLGMILLIYGILLLIGLGMGNSNPLRPLKNIGISYSNAPAEGLIFKKITSIVELNQILEQASTNNQWLMLDFYADWCISCKEMEAFTFTDEKIKKELANFILLQADVTKNSVDDQTLLQTFNLIGPPAILFFGPDKQEKLASRVIGYQNSEKFLTTIKQLKTNE